MTPKDAQQLMKRFPRGSQAIGIILIILMPLWFPVLFFTAPYISDMRLDSPYGYWGRLLQIWGGKPGSSFLYWASRRRMDRPRARRECPISANEIRSAPYR